MHPQAKSTSKVVCIYPFTGNPTGNVLLDVAWWLADPSAGPTDHHFNHHEVPSSFPDVLVCTGTADFLHEASKELHAHLSRAGARCTLQVGACARRRRLRLSFRCRLSGPAVPTCADLQRLPSRF